MDSRKVVVYEFMTLDGVAEDVAGFFTEWTTARWMPPVPP
jgi:hypothetical protein